MVNDNQPNHVDVGGDELIDITCFPGCKKLGENAHYLKLEEFEHIGDMTFWACKHCSHYTPVENVSQYGYAHYDYCVLSTDSSTKTGDSL